jgi:hypothetical protein
VGFFLLDREAAAALTAGRAPTRRSSTGVAVGEGRSNYYRKPNTNLFVMKGKFVNKSWIFLHVWWSLK